MTDRTVCKSSDHLFVPILEVTVPLLRCIHCNVFAYQETVKQLARNRAYRPDEVERVRVMDEPGSSRLEFARGLPQIRTDRIRFGVHE